MRHQATGLNRHQILDYTMRWRTFRRVAMGVLVGALLLAAILPAPAHAAAPEPSVTFGASVTNANGSLTTRLTWSAPGATGCTAAGHEDWTGAKPAAGSLDLPAITLSGTYTLTLSCAWPADTSARLSWSVPTQYTDGTALNPADLSGYRAYHGDAPGNLTDVRQISGGTTTAYQFDDLALGTHYFAVSAVSTAGVESALSSIGSKVIRTPDPHQSAVTLTVNPIPAAPGDLTVQ